MRRWSLSLKMLGREKSVLQSSVERHPGTLRSLLSIRTEEQWVSGECSRRHWGLGWELGLLKLRAGVRVRDSARAKG